MKTLTCRELFYLGEIKNLVSLKIVSCFEVFCFRSVDLLSNLHATFCDVIKYTFPAYKSMNNLDSDLF